MGVFEIFRLRGIDTIAVEIERAADPVLLRNIVKNKGEAPAYGTVILDAFKDVFSSERRISVIPWKNVIAGDKNIDSSLIIAKFQIFVQPDLYADKKINVAALTVKYFYIENQRPVELPMIMGVIPFTIPPVYEEFSQKLGTVTRYLIKYMPSFYACANAPAESSLCKEIDLRQMWSEK